MFSSGDLVLSLLLAPDPDPDPPETGSSLDTSPVNL
jgi:hypothetical protein